jgi:hypothetical protein
MRNVSGFGQLGSGREIPRFARNDSIRRARGFDVVGELNEGVFAVDAAAAELEMVVEEEGAGGFAGLDSESG